jgi:hypothetical protein
MDPKDIPGSCDFIYQRGDKKGRRCNGEGWLDKENFRCKRHRASIVKCWHRIRDRDNIRAKYNRLLATINQQQRMLASYQRKLKLTRERAPSDESGEEDSIN